MFSLCWSDEQRGMTGIQYLIDFIRALAWAMGAQKKTGGCGYYRVYAKQSGTSACDSISEQPQQNQTGNADTDTVRRIIIGIQYAVLSSAILVPWTFKI